MGTNGGLDKVLDSICKVVYKVVYREREREIFYELPFLHGLCGQSDNLTR